MTVLVQFSHFKNYNKLISLVPLKEGWATVFCDPTADAKQRLLVHNDSGLDALRVKTLDKAIRLLLHRLQNVDAEGQEMDDDVGKETSEMLETMQVSQGFLRSDTLSSTTLSGHHYKSEQDCKGI